MPHGIAPHEGITMGFLQAFSLTEFLDSLISLAGAFVLGTLIGADLTNLDKLSGLGAPVASIGGAGTFDGIFLTGILAVILANLFPHRRARDPQPWAT